MKLKKSTIILMLFSVLILFGIFRFSSEAGTESGITSIRVTRLICRIIFFNYKGYDDAQREFIVSGLCPFVRKLAHFSEYCLLGAMIFGTVSSLTDAKKAMRSFAISFFIVFILASLDEIHQYFVPGRAMRFRDVLIDCSGALLGFLTVAVIISLYKTYVKQK